MTKVLVAVAAYDCIELVERCMASIAEQTYRPRVIVIDDASPDPAQAELIDETCRRHGWTAVANSERMGAAYNYWAGIRLMDPASDEVIVIVDGDDRLHDEGALQRIVDVYERDPECWLTYGSFESDPPLEEGRHPAPYPAEVIAERSYRDAALLFNHPLTFRGFLFAQVGAHDMQLPDGTWLPAGYDEALMYPMLEVGGEHARCLDDVLYTYTPEHPNATYVTRRPEADRATAALRPGPARAPVMTMHDGGLMMAPEDRARVVCDYARRYGSEMIVETGSAAGDNAAMLAEWTDLPVITIELDHSFYLKTINRNRDDRRVLPIHGDSPGVIRSIADWVPPRTVWWLDAHIDDWAHAPKGMRTTPITEEIFLVMSRHLDDVILIDDARLFGLAQGYPDLAAVGRHVHQLDESYSIETLYDIIRATPPAR